jgi:hypothetical protein
MKLAVGQPFGPALLRLLTCACTKSSLTACVTSHSGAGHVYILLQMGCSTKHLAAVIGKCTHTLRGTVPQAPGVFRAPRFPFGRRRDLLSSAAAASRNLVSTADDGIIGEDDRKIVSTSVFPYSAVARLVYKVKDEVKSQCTASFIANKVLVTSASCIYDEDRQFFYDFSLISVYDVHKKELDAVVDTAIVTADYSLGDATRDIAVIILATSMQTDTVYGSLGYGKACSAPTPGTAMLLGYPGVLNVRCAKIAMLLPLLTRMSLKLVSRSMYRALSHDQECDSY